jgi:hypothetical protein
MRRHNPDAALLALWASIQKDVRAQNAVPLPAQIDEAYLKAQGEAWRPIEGKRRTMAAMVPTTKAGARAVLAVMGVYDEWDAPKSARWRRDYARRFCTELSPLNQLSLADLWRMAEKGRAA